MICGENYLDKNTMDNNKQTLKDLIELYEGQITQLTMMSKIELGDDVIEEINRLKSQLLGGDNMNNIPDTTIDKKELETLMIMYLDGIEFYGTDNKWVEAKNVLDDFMRYVNSMTGYLNTNPVVLVEGEMDVDEYYQLEDDYNQLIDDYNQLVREYNAMKKKSEINDIMEIQNQMMENMTVEQIKRMQLVSVLDDIQSMMHELTLDERNELIDEVTCVYERFSDVTDMRKGEKPE